MEEQSVWSYGRYGGCIRARHSEWDRAHCYCLGCEPVLGIEGGTRSVVCCPTSSHTPKGGGNRLGVVTRFTLKTFPQTEVFVCPRTPSSLVLSHIPSTGWNHHLLGRPNRRPRKRDTRVPEHRVRCQGAGHHDLERCRRSRTPSPHFPPIPDPDVFIARRRTFALLRRTDRTGRDLRHVYEYSRFL